jgi:hypothetical protein
LNRVPEFEAAHAKQLQRRAERVGGGRGRLAVVVLLDDPNQLGSKDRGEGDKFMRKIVMKERDKNKKDTASCGKKTRRGGGRKRKKTKK